MRVFRFGKRWSLARITRIKAGGSCDCATAWNGETIHCIPIGEVSKICQQATKIIGIKERVLDGGILSNAVSTAWASNNFPVSISEGILRALTSIADEYRAHRNPDLGAQDNLTQLLEPQLNALFLRYTMHSCSAASLHPSTDPPIFDIEAFIRPCGCG